MNDDDPNGPFRGLVYGILLSIPLWGLIALVVWFIHWWVTTP